MDIIANIVNETDTAAAQVQKVIDLITDGNTISFIARYRKEMTGGLDEVQLRAIRDRFDYLTELEERKQVILKSIEEQGKLTDALKAKITETTVKQVLEDLYLPYKPKKRTRATIAKEKGLEPLASLMVEQADDTQWVRDYLASQEGDMEEPDVRQGARDIIAEWISEDAELKEELRHYFWSQGELKSSVQKAFENQKTKFEMYYDFGEPIRQIPAHRYLAVRRGEEESVLRLKFEVPKEEAVDLIKKKWIRLHEARTEDLELAIEDSFQRLLLPSIEVELRVQLKTKADDESIQVFSGNLRELLLAPLGGTKMIMGMDPGYKSGTKWVVVDETGKFLTKGVIYPTPPQNKIEQAKQDLKKVLAEYPCPYICIGNGTASREIMQFVRDFLKASSMTTIQPLIVNESGASVYSASEIAREEFPDLDVSFRGAISIARRFQDPLAELVKIDPKSIGVGQYQHDVNQKKLKKSLDEVVESCVNYVGVNLNTASPSLLSYVSGLNKTLAKNVINYRDENGAFTVREDLLKVTRFGPKSFQQAAGFLRINDGSNPLDQSAVHPEHYPVVMKMADDLNIPVADLIGNEQKLNAIKLSDYQTETVGMMTLRDIRDELKKPGRDPRSEYVGAKLDDEVTRLSDLTVGMSLEGTVTNLTNFGAFVDIGVHQDGLIHVSELSDQYVKDPSEVCTVGDIVKVRVINLDIDRKRIGLSMKSGQDKKAVKPAKKKDKQKRKKRGDINQDLNRLAEKFKAL